MTRFLAFPLVLSVVLPLTGCGGTTSDGVTPSKSSLVLERPYRNSTDTCALIGQSPEVAAYLDDHADLVGCPVTYDGIARFEAETGAIRIGESQGYVLLTILR